MATLLQNRVQRLKLRKSDPDRGIVRLVNDSLRKSDGRFDSAQEAKEYISESMTAVDADYTQRTFEESERIQKQIAEACSTNSIEVTFRNQGSVTNDTHIKFFSDIDLLVITEKFITLKSPLEPTNPYSGDPLQDLKNLRKIIEDRLTSSFYEAKVDKTGTKAVRISGGSLKRDIDVIAANWFDTQEYRNSGKNEQLRGVNVLDLASTVRLTNFPFLHNREIDQKDKATGGALRKIIRFVKAARYDADTTIKVSSYDIASLCYHLDSSELIARRSDNIRLTAMMLEFSNKLANDSQIGQNLYVPNKTRLLFGADGIKADQLKLLNEEIAGILAQAQSGGGFSW